MEHNIREHMDFLFQDAPRTARVMELKEELIANLIDKYHDLVQQGETEETAYNVAISGIGDVEELINGLREADPFDSSAIYYQRQRSAILIAVAVGLYIISLIFPIIFGLLIGTHLVGVIFMFLCWGIATALLVYNALAKPKYVKTDETIVEEFKEWKVAKQKKNTFYQMIQTLVWTITLPLYLILGVFFNAWHPGWLVFLLAPVINMIVRLAFLYKEGS